ncbi:uncharacterized protein MKK02DRAFT_31640 [Dioszegia hungarica]|uniref:Transcription factor domain-containing protein n=1 Tax=Dioszegia hungarica TaxID=4972 RepID=A0AA38HET9_9TREE|nr:uncharacterized protein MKK02DRAFT_31640 [Dioszegia hungarica]KAI9638149.1 hypothetical protein MKK02DRAFT_31640 [Dioszegia hungarica]
MRFNPMPSSSHSDSVPNEDERLRPGKRMRDVEYEVSRALPSTTSSPGVGFPLAAPPQADTAPLQPSTVEVFAAEARCLEPFWDCPIISETELRSRYFPVCERPIRGEPPITLSDPGHLGIAEELGRKSTAHVGKGRQQVSRYWNEVEQLVKLCKKSPSAIRVRISMASFEYALRQPHAYDLYHKSIEAISYAREMDLELEGPHQQIVEQDGDVGQRLERFLFWSALSRHIMTSVLTGKEIMLPLDKITVKPPHDIHNGDLNLGAYEGTVIRDVQLQLRLLQADIHTTTSISTNLSISPPPEWVERTLLLIDNTFTAVMPCELGRRTVVHTQVEYLLAKVMLLRASERYPSPPLARLAACATNARTLARICARAWTDKTIDSAWLIGRYLYIAAMAHLSTFWSSRSSGMEGVQRVHQREMHELAAGLFVKVSACQSDILGLESTYSRAAAFVMRDAVAQDAGPEDREQASRFFRRFFPSSSNPWPF